MRKLKLKKSRNFAKTQKNTEPGYKSEQEQEASWVLGVDPPQHPVVQ